MVGSDRSASQNRIQSQMSSKQSPKKTSEKKYRNKKHSIVQKINIFLIPFSLVTVISIIVIFLNSSFLQDNQGVSAGVHIEGKDVSGYTYEELISFLSNEFDDDLASKVITVKVKDTERTLSFLELGVKYDIEEAARKAFEVGRDGDLFQRVKSKLNNAGDQINVDMGYTYDEEILESTAREIAKEESMNSEDAVVTYTDTTVTIEPGVPGIDIDIDDLIKQFKEALSRFESMTIDVKLKISEPDKLSADRIFNTINKPAINASFTIVENKSIEVIDEISGQIIDRAELDKAIADLNAGKESRVVLEIQRVTPEITKDAIARDFFKDVLGTAYTTFSTNSVNNRNRRDNMTLASEQIDGFIMAPGDEFSFNEVVGQRTAAKGYKTAGAFANGQVIDDIGGGICQVSSTLYNVVLYADIEVTSRQNHSFYVDYTISGIDATVSYPAPAFKFKNTTDYPIKITCSVEDSRISFSIMGTQVGPTRTITLSGETRETVAYKEIITEDPTQPVGYRNVTQSGKTGYLIDTYKTIQLGDGEPVKTKIASNRYKTLDQLVIVGTMPVETPEEILIMPDADDDNFISDQADGTSNTEQQLDSSENAPEGTMTGDQDDSTIITTTINAEEITVVRTPRPTRTPRPRDIEDENSTTEVVVETAAVVESGSDDDKPVNTRTSRPTRTPRSQQEETRSEE